MTRGTASFAGCTTGQVFPLSEPGAYTFRVRSIDSAGNIDPIPAIRDFTVDTTPPEIYDFAGFFQPVENLPTLNLVPPGQAIPVRCRRP